MINPYTLAIEKIDIPDNIIDSLYSQYNVVQLCSVFASMSGLIVTTIYILLYYDVTENSKTVAISYALSIATVLVSVVVWILSKKCKVRFKGFAVLLGLLGSCLKIEQLVNTYNSFENATDPYNTSK